ncbi:hypothetical protein B0J13DRAFT_158886 [Dactylonectria estremocensis]|uniref:C2H2-type domain-containing protein n=1 Tax=Dactylonectria estremocensis TaxID=1079267 RepID=A0A9P9DLQ3_9HYPO|nr:hypothetical protein B0J13DRAFT_158886 [Dactylonectria estremocensis]
MTRGRYATDLGKHPRHDNTASSPRPNAALSPNASSVFEVEEMKFGGMDFTRLELAHPLQSGNVLNGIDFDSLLFGDDPGNPLFDSDGAFRKMESCGNGAVPTTPEQNKHSMENRALFICEDLSCSRDQGFASKIGLDRHKKSVHHDLSILGP